MRSSVIDLLGRHWDVLRASWRDREALEAPARTRDESDFLPAALAVQESPPSPLPRVTMWALMILCAAAVAWASFGQIEIVATARGRIVPSDRSKLIQSAETATVQRILVTDGQAVRSGQPLIELDGTLPGADAARVNSELIAARLEAARQEAFLSALAGGTAVIESDTGASEGRLAEERRLLDGQILDMRTRLARLDAEIDRRRAELATGEQVAAKLEHTAPIARQRAADYRHLMQQSFVSRHGYLEREQARIELERDLATQRSRLAELAAQLRETEGQRAALLAESRRVALEKLAEARRRASQLEQESVKAQRRHGMTRLVAPVDGTVQQLTVHTVGGVVTPAQVLMVLVPTDHPVEVEAMIENKDIGFVHAGQPAEVKVDTFPYTRYGTIPARLAVVSGDAASDDKRGTHYAARVRLERDRIVTEGRSVALAPGMTVLVEIKTGSRRVIEYFLSPLTQYRSESLRER